MKFSDIKYSDKYNVIKINTDNNTFSAYEFGWNREEKIYVHKLVTESKNIVEKNSNLTPLDSYQNELKRDITNGKEDFTQYFVFPVLSSVSNYGKEELLTYNNFVNLLEKKKYISISGASNCGKTTLLKFIYLSLIGNKIPLFLGINNNRRINPNTIIKTLFREQYGDNDILFEKYCQLDKKQKILIIDGWEELDNSNNSLSKFLALIKREYAYIIISENEFDFNLIENVKNEIDPNKDFEKFQIKPFYKKKRRELVDKTCKVLSLTDESTISQINKLIDSLVNNYSTVFSLTPSFIIQYIDYLIHEKNYEYQNGEAIFSKIFEHNTMELIIKYTKKQDVDEFITAFEEVAGFIHKNKQDILTPENFNTIIENYRNDYGVNIKAKDLLEVGLRAKILNRGDNLEIYFVNKNQLAYFIARYLNRAFINDQNVLDIEYVLKNICFGINADIVLFISYLTSNMQLIMMIRKYAEDLISDWEKLDIDSGNIKFISNSPATIEVQAPTESEQQEYEETINVQEEKMHSSEIIEAKGIYEYDEQDIDKYSNKLTRAIKYTELVFKSLPAFYSITRVSQKQWIVDSIYSYPHKILYAMLQPIDENLDMFCDGLIEFTREYKIKDKNDKEYDRNSIIKLLQMFASYTILGTYDQFAQLCTTQKTVEFLKEIPEINTNNLLERLHIMENSGDTDKFLYYADQLMKTEKNDYITMMIREIARKHLLTNPSLPYDKKMKIIDKIFGQSARKSILLEISKKESKSIH